MRWSTNDPVIYIDIRDEIHFVQQVYPEISQNNLLVYFTQVFDYACDLIDKDIDPHRSYFNPKEYYTPIGIKDMSKFHNALADLEKSFIDMSEAIGDKIDIANRKVKHAQWFHYRLSSFNRHRGDAVLTTIIPY